MCSSFYIYICYKDWSTCTSAILNGQQCLQYLYTAYVNIKFSHFHTLNITDQWTMDLILNRQDDRLSKQFSIMLKLWNSSLFFTSCGLFLKWFTGMKLTHRSLFLLYFGSKWGTMVWINIKSLYVVIEVCRVVLAP